MFRHVKTHELSLKDTEFVKVRSVVRYKYRMCFTFTTCYLSNLSMMDSSRPVLRTSDLEFQRMIEKLLKLMY
jgi:hypothetical protein